ncbi:unnamed protein product [Amaranthus hypochondriacus]
MMPLILPLSSPPSLSLSSPFLPKLNYFHNHGGQLRYQKLNSKHKKLHLRRTGICKAELQQDAPFAIAIGACMLNSLLFTGIGESLSEDDEDGVIGATDARFSVMTIISLIPYFNWLVSSKILKLLTDFEMQIDNMTYELENAYILRVFGIHLLLEVFGLVL